MSIRRIEKYGWIPDLPDRRDLVYSASIKYLSNLPTAVDLRALCPPVYDQGQLGSCTANAICGAFEFDLARQHLADFVPSRLFLYYNERAMEGTVSSDSGAQIRDGIKSVASQGVCSETVWPYDISQFAQKPPAGDYTLALNNRALQYMSVSQNLDQLKACLAAGFPFVFGFSVYSSFESDEVTSTGVVPMPAADESLLGGHAVVAVGYSEPDQRFICRNSWGTNWGQQGYFTMPYAYLLSDSLAADFWTIRLVSEE